MGEGERGNLSESSLKISPVTEGREELTILGPLEHQTLLGSLFLFISQSRLFLPIHCLWGVTELSLSQLLHSGNNQLAPTVSGASSRTP